MLLITLRRASSGSAIRRPDELGKPYADGGVGEWMRACPTTPMLELSDEEALWGWRSRLGRPGLHTPTHRANILPSGLACGACLDVAGVRYGTCARQLFLKRHHGIARLLQDLARASGATTAREQALACHVRPTHSADLSIVDHSGRQIWVDVRCFTCPADEILQAALKRHELAKRREYGLSAEFVAMAHWEGVHPFAVEANGRMGPCAISLVQHLTTLAAQRRTQQLQQTWQHALISVKDTFHGPLSAFLLRMSHQALWHVLADPPAPCHLKLCLCFLCLS